MTTQDEIMELGNRWATAEQNGDPNALAGIAHEDFRLVGPFGFVLDKQQWVDRYDANGALHLRSVVWDEVSVKTYGNAAISIGRHTQQGRYGELNVDGQFRITHVWVRDEDRWLLAGIHMSQAAPPEPPPGS
jgi:ketosteroid isomerase-like protein